MVGVKSTLFNSYQIPGFGVGALEKPDGFDPTYVETVRLALKNGWRHFDGAEAYKTSAEIGVALSEVTGSIPRDSLFITSKVHPDMGIASNDVEGSLRAVLKALKLDYIDLYLIHNPWLSDGATIEGVWKQMEDVQRKGLTRAIGVSNFGPAEIEKVLSFAEIKPAVNQIEMHPYLYKEDLPTIKICRDNGIVISAYSPLVAIGRHNGGPLVKLAEKIGAKYNVTSAQVLLRWSIQKGFVPITSSTNEERQKQQLNLQGFALTKEEEEEIDDVGATYHFRGFGWGAFKKEYIGTFASS